jgi:hypothetical protein
VGGWENALEQKKLEARKMFENGDETYLSSARFVGCWKNARLALSIEI